MSSKIYSLNNNERPTTPTEYKGIIGPVNQLCQTVGSRLGLDYYRLRLNRIMSYEIRESSSSELIDLVRLNLAVGVFKAPIEKNLVHLLIDPRIVDVENPSELQICYARALATLPLAFAVYKKNNAYVNVFADYITYDTRQPINKDAFTAFFNKLVVGFTDLFLKAIDSNNPEARMPALSSSDSSMLTILGAFLDALADDYEFQCYLDPLHANKKNLNSMGVSMSKEDIAYLTDSYSKKLEEIDIGIVPPEDAAELSEAEIKAYQFIQQLDPNPKNEMNVSLLGIIKAMYMNDPKQALEYAETYKILNGRKNPKQNKSIGDNMHSNNKHFSLRRNPDETKLYKPQLLQYKQTSEGLGLDVYPMSDLLADPSRVLEVADIRKSLESGCTSLKQIIAFLKKQIEIGLQIVRIRKDMEAILQAASDTKDNESVASDFKAINKKYGNMQPTVVLQDLENQYCLSAAAGDILYRIGVYSLDDSSASKVSQYTSVDLLADSQKLLFNLLCEVINNGSQLTSNIAKSFQYQGLDEANIEDLLSQAGIIAFSSARISNAFTQAIAKVKIFDTIKNRIMEAVGSKVVHENTVKIIMSQDISNKLGRTPFSLDDCRITFFSNRLNDKQVEALLEALSFNFYMSTGQGKIVGSTVVSKAPDTELSGEKWTGMVVSTKEPKESAVTIAAVARTNQSYTRDLVLSRMLTINAPTAESIASDLRIGTEVVRQILTDEFNKAAGLGYQTVSELSQYFTVPGRIPEGMDIDKVKKLVMSALFDKGSMSGTANSLKELDIKVSRIKDIIIAELNQAIMKSDATVSGILSSLSDKWIGQITPSLDASIDGTNRSLTAEKLGELLKDTGFSRYVTWDSIKDVPFNEATKGRLKIRAEASDKGRIIINESANATIIEAVERAGKGTSIYYYTPNLIKTRVVLDSVDGGSLSVVAVQGLLRNLNMNAKPVITRDEILDAISKGHRNLKALAKYFNKRQNEIAAAVESNLISLESDARVRSGLGTKTSSERFEMATNAALINARKYKYDALISDFLMSSNLIEALLNVLLINDRVTRIVVSELCKAARPMTREELRIAAREYLVASQVKLPKDKQPEVKLFDFSTRIKFYQLDLLASRGKGIAKDKNPILECTPSSTKNPKDDVFSLHPILKEKLVVLYIERSRVVDPNFNARYWSYLIRPTDTLAKVSESERAKFKALFDAIPGLEHDLLIAQSYPDYSIIPKEYKDIIKPRVDKEGKRIQKPRAYSYLSSVAFGKSRTPIKSISGLLNATANERDVKNLINPEFLTQFFTLINDIQTAAKEVYDKAKLKFNGISALDIMFTIGMAKRIAETTKTAMAIPDKKLIQLIFWKDKQDDFIKKYSSTATYAIKPLILELIDIMTKLMVIKKDTFIQDNESDKIMSDRGLAIQPVPSKLVTKTTYASYSQVRNGYSLASIPDKATIDSIVIEAYNIAVEREKKRTLGSIASPARLRKVLDVLYRSQGIQSSASFRGVQLQKLASLTTIRAEDVYVLLQMLIYNGTVEAVYSNPIEARRPLTNAQLERRRIKHKAEMALSRELRSAVDRIHALSPAILGRALDEAEELIVKECKELLTENEDKLIAVFRATSSDRLRFRDEKADKLELLYSMNERNRKALIDTLLERGESPEEAIKLISEAYTLSEEEKTKLTADFEAKERVQKSERLLSLPDTLVLHYRLTAKSYDDMSIAESNGRELAYLNHLKATGEADEDVSKKLEEAYGLRYGKVSSESELTYVSPDVYMDYEIAIIRTEIVGGHLKGDLQSEYSPEKESASVLESIADPSLIKSIMTILFDQEQKSQLLRRDESKSEPEFKKALTVGQILSRHLKGSELFYDTQQSDELYDKIYELLSVMKFHNYIRSDLVIEPVPTIKRKDVSRGYWISTTTSVPGEPTMYQRVKKFFEIEGQLKPFYEMLDPQGNFKASDYADKKDKLSQMINSAYSIISEDPDISKSMNELTEARNELKAVASELASTRVELLDAIQTKIDAAEPSAEEAASGSSTKNDELAASLRTVMNELAERSDQLEGRIITLQQQLQELVRAPDSVIFGIVTRAINPVDLIYYDEFWDESREYLLANPRFLYEVGVSAVEHIKDIKTIGIIEALNSKTQSKRLQGDKLGDKVRIVRKLSLKARKPRAKKKAKGIELVSVKTTNSTANTSKANASGKPTLSANQLADINKLFTKGE